MAPSDELLSECLRQLKPREGEGEEIGPEMELYTACTTNK